MLSRAPRPIALLAGALLMVPSAFAELPTSCTSVTTVPFERTVQLSGGSRIIVEFAPYHQACDVGGGSGLMPISAVPEVLTAEEWTGTGTLMFEIRQTKYRASDGSLQNLSSSRSTGIQITIGNKFGSSPDWGWTYSRASDLYVKFKAWLVDKGDDDPPLSPVWFGEFEARIYVAGSGWSSPKWVHSFVWDAAYEEFPEMGWYDGGGSEGGLTDEQSSWLGNLADGDWWKHLIVPTEEQYDAINDALSGIPVFGLLQDMDSQYQTAVGFATTQWGESVSMSVVPIPGGPSYPFTMPLDLFEPGRKLIRTLLTAWICIIGVLRCKTKIARMLSFRGMDTDLSDQSETTTADRVESLRAEEKAARREARGKR